VEEGYKRFVARDQWQVVRADTFV